MKWFNNLRYAGRDLWNDRFGILIYAMVIMSIFYVFVSAMSASGIFKDSTAQHPSVAFNAYLTDQSPEISMETKERLIEILNSDQVAIIKHTSVVGSQKQNFTAGIILGDPSILLGDKALSLQGVVGQEELIYEGEELHLDDQLIKVSQQMPLIEWTESLGGSFDVLIIDDQSDSIQRLVKPMSGEEVFELIPWIRMNQSAEEPIKKLEELSEQLPFHIKSRRVENYQRDFLMVNIFPHLLVTSLSSILIGSIVFRGLYRERKKSYAIHQLHGAEIQDLTARILFYEMGVLSIGSVLPMIIFRRDIERLRFLFFTMGVVMLLIALYTIVSVRKDNELNRMKELKV